EVWLRISNFFEVRESFVRVRGNFVLLRAFIVRHCCYPPRRATKPRYESHASKSFSKHTHGIDRMSTAAAYSTEVALIVALHELRSSTFTFSRSTRSHGRRKVYPRPPS